MKSAAIAVAVLGLACTGDSTGSIPVGIDAGPVDGGAPPVPSHVLISEVSSQVLAEEFIELYNPTDRAVDLSDYYLSDDSHYALLPGMSGDGPAPSIGNADFIIGFPAGASIGAGQVVVIARDGDSFNTGFGAAADFAFGGAATVGPMRLVAVGGSPGISNTGEGIALFHWDGASDLVSDVDLVIAGIPGPATDQLADKTGLVVDGPDANGEASMYAADGSTMRAFDQVTNQNQSYQRLDIEGHEEGTSGGNGIGGHDETREDLSRSWGTSAMFAAPTPGTVPAQLAAWPR